MAHFALSSTGLRRLLDTTGVKCCIKCLHSPSLTKEKSRSPRKSPPAARSGSVDYQGLVLVHHRSQLDGGDICAHEQQLRVSTRCTLSDAHDRLMVTSPHVSRFFPALQHLVFLCVFPTSRTSKKRLERVFPVYMFLSVCFQPTSTRDPLRDQSRQVFVASPLLELPSIHPFVMTLFVIVSFAPVTDFKDTTELLLGKSKRGEAFLTLQTTCTVLYGSETRAKWSWKSYLLVKPWEM